LCSQEFANGQLAPEHNTTLRRKIKNNNITFETESDDLELFLYFR